MINYIEALENVVRQVGFPNEMIWGQSDCALVMNMYSEACRGEPVIANWPKYSTPKGALKALKSKGFNHLDEALDVSFTRLSDIVYPVAGDVVAVKSGNDGPWHSMAICRGDGTMYCATGPEAGPIIWRVAPMLSEFLAGPKWRVE
jgi:hypothetical protein